jgi:hypothetical protein
LALTQLTETTTRGANTTMTRIQMKHFEKVLRYTQQYFVMAYHGGTREMIRRYVAKYTDASPREVSACLQVLKQNGVIVYEGNVWWALGNV